MAAGSSSPSSPGSTLPGPTDAYGHIVFRVAHATGRSVPIVATDPWALTLWTYAQLLDWDRIQRMEQDFARHESAHLTKVAFNDPKGLWGLTRNMRYRYTTLPPVEDLRRSTDATLERARTQRKRILS